MFDIGLDYPGIIMIVTEFQRVFVVFSTAIMVRRVSCGLQLATVPELQVSSKENSKDIFFSEKTIENLCNNLKQQN